MWNDKENKNNTVFSENKKYFDLRFIKIKKNKKLKI